MNSSREPGVLSFTGERIVPGLIPEALFRAHEARYVFAGGFVADKTVLDVACGTGMGTHYLLQAGAQRCIGLDINSPAVDYARARYKGCEFAECDAMSLSLPDSSIDVVVSFETVEHVADHRIFLSECSRVLRCGGRLVCSTPNRTISRWARRNPYHVHEFTIPEFMRALKTAFVDIELYGQLNVNQLICAGRGLVSRTLNSVGMLDAAKRLFRSAPVCIQAEFGETSVNSGSEVCAYRATPLVLPNYVIAVARKAP